MSVVNFLRCDECRTYYVKGGECPTCQKKIARQKMTSKSNMLHCGFCPEGGSWENPRAASGTMIRSSSGRAVYACGSCIQNFKLHDRVIE